MEYSAIWSKMHLVFFLQSKLFIDDWNKRLFCVFNVKLVETIDVIPRWWWSTKSATVSLSGAARFSAKNVVGKSSTIPANKETFSRADSELLII